ncbi:MAG: cyclic nucleotide-binding protein [Firmicutes bacterium]|nr:cyclic nucleotide-binding protein [Bacillota bacterium]
MSMNDLNTMSVPKEPVKLGVATTPEEKQEVYRFRYRIYAEEMSKRFPNMDHKNKVLYDELDDWAFIVYAKAGSEIIGTLRVNIGEHNDFSPFWIQVLDLNKFAKFKNGKQNFAYTSKFMVAPPYRNSTVSYLLAAESYELYCKHNVQFSFGVCNFHLLRLYEQFGFRRFGRNFIDDGYGLLAPYVLLVDDIAHLRAVRSPFFRAARKRDSLNKDALSWFSSEFSETGVIINSQLVSPEELWALLSTRFDSSPNQALAILHGLSDIEALLFLHCCGVIVQCFAGDQLAFKGDTNYALNLLISGRLQQSNSLPTDAPAIAIGQSIGVNGLVNHPTHTENIFAITDAEILVLSSLAFPKFRHLHSDIANKIMQNMANIEAVHQIG